MSAMDVFNLDETIKEFITGSNEDDLNGIAEEFKQGHFSTVLLKTKEFRDKYEFNEGLARILSILDATCYSQIGEDKRGADIIMSLYQDANEKSLDDFILYGNLAFMCDFKLARKIMSEAVKRIENGEHYDPIKTAHAYLVLGEAEENLEKFVRAIKYYKRGLTIIQGEEHQDRQMVLFLHFKLGALHSVMNEIDKAIQYLKKTIELTEEEDIEIKINSLVSIARMYGSIEETEKAIAYLEEAIPLLENSTLAKKLVHAEAYTEMAFNYFGQSKLDEAVTYYERAIAIHLGLSQYSSRELGMIYMQYAYCLENKGQPDKALAGKHYEKAIEELEQTNDLELLESALTDVIEFFHRIGNQGKKRFFENKAVKLMNEKSS